MRFNYLIFTLGLLGLISCKKAEDRSCFKRIGEQTEIRVDLPDFYKLYLKSKLKYTLIQDDSNYMLVKGGKNLVNFVKWRKSEVDYLEINNSNKCAFLRKQSDVIEAEIHFKNIIDLRYEGSEELNTPDTLNFDYLRFVVLDASGTLNMTLKADSLTGDVSHGWGNYNFKGLVKKAYLGLRSNGYADVSDLKVTEVLEIKNESVGDIHINADQVPLQGMISGSGNIYYTGIPSSINIECFSSGKLIKL